MDGVNRVHLLDGEIFSKIVNRRDKVDWSLYGDAGTATLVEKGDYEDSTFLLMSDGLGEDFVKIYAGMRNPITADSLVEKEREEGNIRTELEVYMDGMDVFNFAMRVVPKNVKEVCATIDTTLEYVDYVVFHQVNKFMTDFFVKRLKFDINKGSYCIQKFGNISSCSVPLTIVLELQDKLTDRRNVVMTGFDAGLSWVAAKVVFKRCNIIFKLIEY